MLRRRASEEIREELRADQLIEHVAVSTRGRGRDQESF
jgi:hypothetical protein